MAQLIADIEKYKSILGNPATLDMVVREELREVRRDFADDRRTTIVDAVDEVSIEDLIPEEEIVVVLSRDGFLRRMPLEQYRTQGRGGKGVKGATPKVGDESAIITVSSTHRDIFLFTNKGRVFALKGHVIPEPRTGKGRLAKPVHIPREWRVRGGHEGQASPGRLLRVLHHRQGGQADSRRGTGEPHPAGEEGALPGRRRRDIKVRFTNGEDEIFMVTAKGQALRVFGGRVQAPGPPGRVWEYALWRATAGGL